MNKLLVLVLIAAFFSCSNDCQSERIEDQSFEAESLEFQSWIDKEELVFKDLDGNEEVYTKTECTTVMTDNDRFFLDCDEEEFIVYKSEVSLCRFEHPESGTLSYAHNIELFDDNETDPDKLVDVLTLSFFETSSPGQSLNQASFVTAARKSNEDVDFRNLSNFNFQDSVEIGDKVFYDVFVQRDNLDGFMFTKAKGIVGFSNGAGTQFYLDSCE